MPWWLLVGLGLLGVWLIGYAAFVVFLACQGARDWWRSRDGRTRLSDSAKAFAAIAVIGFLVFVAASPGRFPGEEVDASAHRYDYVTTYCMYGVVSDAQLQGCIEHVSDADVDGRDTNAAQFARGEMDECRLDSGPFCEEAR